MNILFICKFNRFRSKVAEAFFKKYNLNKEHKAKSAGLIRGSTVSPEIKKAAKEFGLNLRSEPQGLSTKLLKWHDTTIIVANDVPRKILEDNKRYGKKLKVWKIPDTRSDNAKEMKKIISQIEIKVKSFIKELK